VRSRNEDVAAVLSVRYAANWNRDFDVAIVCDGMGGMADGREAALLAASIFLARCARVSRNAPARDKLISSVLTAQSEVQQRLRGRGGTTLSAVYTDRDSNAWFAHVGDTRVFSVTNGSTLQVSRSDTVGALLNRIDETPESSRLIQFVGMDDEIQPQIDCIMTSEASGLLITSDGAHGVTKDVWDTVCLHAKSGSDLVRKLLNVADAFGGLDNATALYIPPRVSDEPSPDDGPGMTIRLISLAGEREIWVSNGADNEVRPPIVRSVQQSQVPPEHHGQEGSTKKRKGGAKSYPKGGAKPKRAPKPKREQPEPGMLPLEDSAETAKLDFSDEVEG
jgi:serine/threonine protein phosphatase PrpC